MNNVSTAAIVIIGDEILQGEAQDTNSHFLCQELQKNGVKVGRISVIPDVVDVIAAEVRKLSDQYKYVITTGGIGPTHDDVTYEGIARAFNEELSINKEYENLMQLLCDDLTPNKDVITNMCCIPKSSRIHHTKKGNRNFIPIVSVRNVYIYPGVPSYLHYTFNSMKSLFTSNTISHSRKIYFDINEFMLTKHLNDVVAQFGDQVQFGSYCQIGNDSYQVEVSLKSESEAMLQLAEAYLRSTCPANSIIGPTSPESKESVAEFCSLLKETSSELSPFVKAVTESVKIAADFLRTQSLQNICLSFNGGKDCTALLHLVNYIFHKEKIAAKLKVFYVCNEDTFVEVDEFVCATVDRYNLELLQYSFPIKDALAKLKVDHPEITHILMGTRLADPHSSKMQTFQKTDADWPQFTRVSPILNWSFHNVWKFFRRLNIPYCSLYDQGYTSLGCSSNTLPNDQLKSVTPKGREFFLPAYMLADPEQERTGRNTCL